MQIEDKKLFRALIVSGFSLVIVGVLVNFSLAALQPRDFNFLGAIIGGLGILIIFFTLVYTLFKVSFNLIKRKK